jgi:hypothetical protein
MTILKKPLPPVGYVYARDGKGQETNQLVRADQFRPEKSRETSKIERLVNSVKSIPSDERIQYASKISISDLL